MDGGAIFGILLIVLLGTPALAALFDLSDQINDKE